MNITLLNGEPSASSAFDAYVRSFAAALEADGHGLRRIELRDLEYEHCSGCWGCWVKTPGECVKRDDGEVICRAVLGCDLAILASPMLMGFTSALLKRAGDRLIPLVHPYLVVEGGEIHHRARYGRHPLFGLVLGAGADADDEDLAITRDIWSRTARNLKSRLVFTTVVGEEGSTVVPGTAAGGGSDLSDAAAVEIARKAASEAAKEADRAFATRA